MPAAVAAAARVAATVMGAEEEEGEVGVVVEDKLLLLLPQLFRARTPPLEIGKTKPWQRFKVQRRHTKRS